MQANLAISLHSADDKIRTQLMPINKVYTLDKLMNSVNNYISKTGRRITFEYLLLKDINDKKEDAVKLVNLIKDINCYVNLIPYNKTNNNELDRSLNKTMMEFYDILKKNKINCTIRKEFGSKIKAACGQLVADSKE